METVNSSVKVSKRRKHKLTLVITEFIFIRVSIEVQRILTKNSTTVVDEELRQGPDLKIRM